MLKGVVIFLFVLILMPSAYSIPIKELLSRYNFFTATPTINITNNIDFMIDENNNGINDTLIIELTTNNANGNFIFIVNLFDKGGTLTNEINKTLAAGANKINMTFNSIFLSQHQFNYSIKIYNSSYSLKYRKDNILTQNYPEYEEGFSILDIKDSKANKTLIINATVDSTVNGTFETSLILNYNNSVLSKKESKLITNSLQDLIFIFDSETIKRTHYIGNFNVSSLRIGKKMIRTNFTSGFYDFKDFANSSYFVDFADNGVDVDNDNKYNILQIDSNVEIINDGYYTFVLALYDLFDNIIEIKNVTFFLNTGNNLISFLINGSEIYDKKLNGPFIVEYAQLFENGVLMDQTNNVYITKNYDFNDFDGPDLPDLDVNIELSDSYNYGIDNITVNITFNNIGDKNAFNVFTEIFDNNTFIKSNKTNILGINSKILYQIHFSNFSDFEINAIADFNDFVEEVDESNNFERFVIKLNKHPILEPITNITVIETDKILINLSASDPNDDNLSFSINSSKFLNNSNIFEWDTTTNDSGDYTLTATVSDGFLNDTSIFKIIILDIPENDIDSDGIDDSIDKLIGNKNSVNTSTINLSILIGNTSNLSKNFNTSYRVKFLDINLTILEFDFNFSVYRLNLTNITINKQLDNQKGSLFTNGLRLPKGTKTMYVDKIDTKLNGVCIKDTQISSINEISSNCKSKNEVKISCNGKLSKSYKCTYNSTINKLKVEGLKNSGIVQFKV